MNVQKERRGEPMGREELVRDGGRFGEEHGTPGGDTAHPARASVWGCSLKATNPVLRL